MCVDIAGVRPHFTGVRGHRVCVWTLCVSVDLVCVRPLCVNIVCVRVVMARMWPVCVCVCV